MSLPLLLLVLQSACVEVAGDRITAADLAAAVPAFQKLDPAAPLGYAPMAGVARWLGRRELAALLAGTESALQLPSAICVVRKAVRPGEDVLAAAMRRALPPDAAVVIVRGTAAAVPEGELVFQPTGIRPAGVPGVYSWTGHVRPAGGGRSVTVSAVVKIELRRQVLIAKRTLPAGLILGEGDLAVETRDVGWPPPDPPEAPGAYIGWKTRRPFQAGETVHQRWLAPPLAVRPGSPIALSVEQAGARLRVEALALTGGRQGDTILVKSPFAAARVRARLTGPGEAVLAAGEAARNRRDVSRETSRGSQSRDQMGRSAPEEVMNRAAVAEAEKFEEAVRQ